MALPLFEKTLKVTKGRFPTIMGPAYHFLACIAILNCTISRVVMKRSPTMEPELALWILLKHGNDQLGRPLPAQTIIPVRAESPEKLRVPAVSSILYIIP